MNLDVRYLFRLDPPDHVRLKIMEYYSLFVANSWWSSRTLPTGTLDGHCGTTLSDFLCWKGVCTPWQSARNLRTMFDTEPILLECDIRQRSSWNLFSFIWTNKGLLTWQIGNERRPVVKRWKFFFASDLQSWSNCAGLCWCKCSRNNAMTDALAANTGTKCWRFLFFLYVNDILFKKNIARINITELSDWNHERKKNTWSRGCVSARMNVRCTIDIKTSRQLFRFVAEIIE